MSIYLTIDGSEPRFVASNSGWSDFTRWVDGVDGDDLKHLCEHGWSEPLGDVRKQLHAAVKDKTPSADIRGVASNILDFIDGADDDGVVTVTDGLSAKEESAALKTN
jgi:hypothetical protein